MRSIQDCYLYGILDLGYIDAGDAPRFLEKMIEGGVDIVQLRAKGHAPAAIAALGRMLLPIASAGGMPFIINDHPVLAAELNADGVHVGQDDLPVSETRRLIGPGRLVGRSTHSLAQAADAIAHPDETPDYLGFGPLFATPTKPDYAPIGIEEIRRVHEIATIPIFCNGGITRENLDLVLDAGARRVVIVSGILKAEDVTGYCRDVKQRLSGNPEGMQATAAGG